EGPAEFLSAGPFLSTHLSLCVVSTVRTSLKPNPYSKAMPLTAIALSIALAQSESAVGRYLPYAPAENYSGVATPFLEKPLRLWSNGKADLYPLLGGTWQQTGQVIII